MAATVLIHEVLQVFQEGIVVLVVDSSTTTVTFGVLLFRVVLTPGTEN